MVDNMMHFSDENPDVTIIKHQVKNIHNEIKKEEHKKTSEELISLMEGDDEKSLAKFFNDNRFSKELFQFLDKQEFFFSIILLTNKQLFNLTEILAGRYNSTNIGEFLYEDKILLDDIKEKLDSHLAENSDIGQPKLFLLESLNKELERLSNHLEKTKSNNCAQHFV